MVDGLTLSSTQLLGNAEQACYIVSRSSYTLQLFIILNKNNIIIIILLIYYNNFFFKASSHYFTTCIFKDEKIQMSYFSSY